MPAIDQRTLRVSGLRELQTAFALADRELAKELRTELRDVAEPVRAEAEQRASASIRNIGLPWSRMRVGVTRSLVYVAPRERGKASRGNARLRRPNLADLLMGRAMSPALEANQGRIVSGMEDMLGRVGAKWERV